jgi:hypothetical protein
VERWQHFQPADVDAGGAAGDGGEVFGRHQPFAVLQETRHLFFAVGDTFGIGAAPGTDRVAESDAARQCRRLFDAGFVEIATCADTDVVRHAEAGLGRRAFAVAHAIAKLDQASFVIDHEYVYRFGKH